MTDSSDPRAEPFRTVLDDGVVVETDGSTVIDPSSGALLPAVLLRMSGARAHTLAHLLDDWCRMARVFAVLREREHRITPVQRIAVVDAAARWLAEDAGEELAEALIHAVCSDTVNANLVYLALIEHPRAMS